MMTMMNNGDPTGMNQQQAGQGKRSDLRSFLMEFYTIRMARADGDFDFNIIKELIAFASAQIAISETEQERYANFTTYTDLIMAAIEPHIEVLRNKAGSPLPEIYDTLLAEMEACTEGYVNVGMTNAGDDMHEYNIGVSIPSKQRTGNADKEHGSVKCLKQNFDESVGLVTENLYRRLNCTVRPMFRKALQLAVRCEYIDPDKSMSIKGSGIDTKRSQEYQSTMKLQLGEQNG